jgi:hypothetical protein
MNAPTARHAENAKRTRRASIAALLNGYRKQELILKIKFLQLNTAMTISGKKFLDAILLRDF